MAHLKLSIIALGLIIILIFLQYHLWFSSGGIQDLLKIKQMLVEQKNENEKLKKNNEMLLFQIRRLQNGRDEAETRARNDLGMIKKGEIFYQIVK
ncbi:MAG: septum formation initiator family protein [Gammaproteobacteria bacterium]|nr:septum formation initiator family protein [Gammaproteobacteria bacterium]